MAIQFATTLAGVETGRRARVVAIKGGGALSLRLMEMGLVPGTEIAVIKRAPFGDPIELRVRGFHLSLRREEAERVEVDP
jgi:ferrous iron transport protein A